MKRSTFVKGRKMLRVISAALVVAFVFGLAAPFSIFDSSLKVDAGYWGPDVGGGIGVPLFNKESALETGLYWLNNIGGKMGLVETKGGAWVDLTNLSKFETSLYGSRVYGKGSSWSVTFEGTDALSVNTSVTPDLEFRIYGSLGNSSGWMMAGDGLNATTFEDKGYQLQGTEWFPYVQAKAVISGSGTSDLRNIDFVIADLTSPGETRAVIYSMGQDTEGPILWLDFGERIRAANSNIEWDELAAAMRLKLGIVPKDQPEAEIVYVTAAATRHDGQKLGFQIVDEDWAQLVGGEFQIVTVENISPEGGSFELFEFISREDSTEPHYVETPMTDVAGNPVMLPTSENVRIKNLIVDGVSPVVSKVDLKGSAVKELETEPDGWPADIDRSELFSSVGDTVEISIEMDERLAELSASKMKDVTLEWNVQIDGAPVVSNLKAIEHTYSSAFGKSVSVLVFEPLEITADMTPQGVQIKPVMIYGTNALADVYGNYMAETTDLAENSPNRKTYLDTVAPVMSLVPDGVVFGQEADGNKPLTIAFTVSDGEGLTSSVMGEEGKLILSLNCGSPILKYKYEITRSATPPAELSKQGKLVGPNETYILFSTTGTGTYYLHMSLLNVGGIELDNAEGKGIVIGGVFCDAAGNTNDENDMRYYVDNLNIDHVAPKLTLIDKGVTIVRNEAQNDATFRVSYEAKDTNALDRVEYQWVAEGAELVDNGWTLLGNAAGGNATSGTLEKTASGTENVTFTLYVRVYDANGNMKQSKMTLRADMTKVIGRQEYVGEPTAPEAENDILVKKPVSTDESAAEKTYYTRAIVTFVDYEGNVNDYQWVRIFDFADYDSASLLSAENSDEWYCVRISDGAYIDVYTGDELTGEKAVPLSHYGEIQVEFASSANKSALIPVNFQSTTPASENDSSFHEDGSFTFLHTAPRNDVHSVTFGGVTDRNGTVLSMTKYGSDKYYVLNQTMSGAQIPFTIANVKRAAFGYEDIDLKNSYAVLLKADSNGAFDADTDEVTSRMVLANSTEQVFTVPSLDKNGEPFASGAYMLRVHLAQKAGGAQDFVMMETENGSDYDIYLILDASTSPELFGITEYTVYSQVAFPNGSGEVGLPITKTAAEGEVISYINVGVAEPSRYRLDSTSLKENAEKIVYIDGKPAYSLEVTNSISETINSYGGYLNMEIMAQPNETARYFDYDIGVVKGIKFWNSASPGDPSTLPYDEDVRKVTMEDGQIIYVLPFNECLDWYTQYDSDEYTPNVVVVDSKDQLKDMNEDFTVVKGSNTICYQLIMQNGEESPVYQFELNLFDQAPEIELDFELVNSKIFVEEKSEGSIFRNYAEQINVTVVDAYSPYGELQFYRADYDRSTLSWVYTPYDAGESIPLTVNGDGYRGIVSTRKDVTTDRPVEQFIFAVDSVGNAVCAYPILDGSMEIEGDQYYYGIYDSESLEEITVESIPAWSVEEGAYVSTVNRLLFNRNTATPVSKTFEYMTMQVDDRTPVRVDTDVSTGHFSSDPNSAGIVEFGGDTDYRVQVTNYYSILADSIRYDLPYDPAIPDGQLIDHEITLVTYGYADENGKREETTYSFTVTSPNTKPSVTVVEYETEVFLDRIDLDCTPYLMRIDPEEMYPGYSRRQSLEIYGNGVYTVVMEDKYGEEYTFEIPVDNYPEDPKIEFSTAESKLDPTVDPQFDPTTGEVTVTITGEQYNVSVNEDWVNDANVKFVVNNERSVTLTFRQNDSAEIQLTPAGVDSESPEYSTTYFYISVGNIVDETITPSLQWSYTGEAMAENDVVYHEVSVSLIDSGDKELIDPVTGETPTYTFYIGANKGDTYTFSGYTDQYGIRGADVVATLPYNLRTGPVFDDDGAEIVPVADTFCPDLAVTGYTIRNGVSNEIKAAYKLINDRTGANIFVGLPGYEAENRYGASNVYGDIDSLLYRMGWGDEYSFRIDIADENETKLFVKANGADAPDFASGVSDSIDGVKLQGRTVIVSENTEFVLWAVDKDNNASMIPFAIRNLGEAPVPTVSEVPMKDGSVRLFLNVPIDGVTDLRITNNEAALVTDENSAFYGKWYFAQTTNEKVTLYYSYQYDGSVYTGSVDFHVSSIDETLFGLADSGGKWSVNYDRDGKRYTNKEISGQFVFTKPILSIQAVNANSEPIETPEGVSVSWLNDRLTVVYEQNAEAFFLLATAMNGKTHKMELPAITTIDTTAPTDFDVEVTYTDGRQAEITVTAHEAALLELNGLYKEVKTLEAGVPYTVIVGKNGVVTLRFTDSAGNATLKTVTIDQIIDTPLTITVRKDGNVVIPESDEIAVGDVLTVETNRAAEIYFNGVSVGTTAAGAPVTVTVGEDSSGLYPAIRAVDEYGNAALLQLLRIPMGDKLAPSILITRNVIAASASISEGDLEAMLLGNMLFADETTPTGELAVDFIYDRPDSTGVFEVLCTVTDAAGNTASKTVTVRLYDGEEPVIYIGHSGVEEGTPLDARKALWDESVIVSAGEVTLDVRTNGEPYKLVYKKGIKTVAQMKRGVETVTEYTDTDSMVYALDLSEAGYYTVVMTTQGRMTYRIVLYVEETK